MILEGISGILLIGGALYALSAKHLMRGVIGLTAFFIGLAVVFAGLGAWYLAVGQLFLFVGGVVTLFVLAFNFSKTPVQASGKIAGLLVAVIFLAGLGLMVPPIEGTESFITVHQLADIFFGQYGWMLNIALLLLFSALIGAQYFLEAEK